jgi:sec-independent protein translocase protein TatB
MFGISGQEFIVLLILAAVVLGPERLPTYAQQLARLVRELRRMAQGASEQVRAELGPEFDDLDWRRLDPRQYDPRRIVREALAESIDVDDPLGMRSDQRASGGSRPPRASATGSATGTGSAPGGSETPGPADEAPSGPRFDPDAT